MTMSYPPISILNTQSSTCYGPDPLRTKDCTEASLNHGHFLYKTSIAFTSNTTGKETNILVNAAGYGARTAKLQDDFVYMLSGRFILRKEEPSPTVHFKQDIHLNIGPSTNYTTDLANKVGVEGLGVVIQRNTVQGTGSNRQKQTDLHVIHKDKAEFEVKYVVPGNCLQVKTHGLYQLGRKLLISGYIQGYCNFLKFAGNCSGAIAQSLQWFNLPLAASLVNLPELPLQSMHADLSDKRNRETASPSLRASPPLVRNFGPASESLAPRLLLASKDPRQL
ncbi:hypothetical protein PtA15_2A918 [Puccinia triticina]|uniref:Uncharacterized protein n=1 Tax=Puccinia triticina TaxID=208348 RepID=A0ABY7CEM0_9BASI|nr:uncharacterized protein PtA15_2A918 [Puccinia triticina]WAQ82601.1 hypothetical protein PtA15_2A918 [Puccinia triticina]